MKWYPATELEIKPYFTYDYDHSKWKFGDKILIQHVTYEEDINPKQYKISHPIYALFVGFSIWDQALVINYVRQVHRAEIDELDPKVEQIALWSDNVLVLGHWNYTPSLSEFKVAMKNKHG